MATTHYVGYTQRDSLCWDETECLAYYGMLSLHEIFEIIGSQLTETDIEVLSFLLDEVYPGKHPLDPAGWTVQPCEDDPNHSEGVPPSPALLGAWRQLQPRGAACPTAARHKPKSGLELLMELEKRDYIGEGKLEPLLQLLRVLTRHDLLPFVCRKKRRTVSPERIRPNYRAKDKGQVADSQVRGASGLPQTPQEHLPQNWRSGIYPPRNGLAPRRKKRSRGHGWSSSGRTSSSRRSEGLLQAPPPPPLPAPAKVTCNIRLRVRADYMEHESALRGGVSSDKQQPLERQFELFSRANSLLRSRDLGSIMCDIKFTELENLEAFWGDYLSGALLEALKGVFITDALRAAAGREGVRLLISMDQDDYEEGCRLLMAAQQKTAAVGPRGRGSRS
ncbi:death effector domain-containing 1 [Aplochiton taeniatus]